MDQFGAAVEANWSKLVRKASAMVGPADAEDVVVDALVSVWTNPIEPDSWENWMFAAVCNAAKDELRHRQRREGRSGGPIGSLDELEMEQ